MTYDEWKTTEPVEYPDGSKCRHGIEYGEGPCDDCIDAVTCERCGFIGIHVDRCPCLGEEEIL